MLLLRERKRVDKWEVLSTVLCNALHCIVCSGYILCNSY